MKKFILTIATAAFIIGAHAKDDPKKITIDLKASKHEKTRGANPKIKMDEPSKDVEMAKPEGYKAKDNVRGANVANISRKAVIKTRGANTNIKTDASDKDVEKVRPAYSNVKKVEINRAVSSKMRGANANIVHDIPNVDKEAAKPANHEGYNNKGRTVKEVTRHTVEKTRGANTNIKIDEPTTDVEMARPEK